MKYFSFKMSKFWTVVLLSTSVFYLNSCENSPYELMQGVEVQLMNDVALNVESPLKLAPGMQFQVTYTAIPENVTEPGVSWVSSNTEVAEVSQEGLVTAKQLGKSYINISQTTGFNVLKSIELNVVPPATAIQAKDFEVFQGATVSLSDLNIVVVTPVNGYNVFDGESSDNSIITFQNGVFKALKGGTATITVKTKDGSNLQSTAVVTVHPSIEATDLSIKNGQEFGTNEFGAPLAITVTPSNSTLEVIKWSSSDTSIATIDNKARITTLNFGDVEISGKIPSGEVFKATISVVKGKINDYGLGLKIYSLTENATSSINNNGIRRVTYASGKKRSDLLRGSSYLDVDTYPILAVKRNAVNVNKLWQNFDSRIDGGSAGGINMVWANVLPTKDNAQVYFVNLAAVTYGGTTLVGKGAQKMSAFTLKTGTDTNPADLYYDIYWVKTFKSMQDLQDYIANE